jgi:dCMP deaminase
MEKMTKVLLKRHRDYLSLAKFWANLKSKDPSTKCCAVLVRPSNTIASMGYNGYPPGIEDTKERLLDRKFKNRVVKHAEDNALSFSHEDNKGYTIYVWPCIPCPSCASSIIRDGLKLVVCPEVYKSNGGADYSLTLELLEEAGIQLMYGEA